MAAALFFYLFYHFQFHTFIIKFIQYIHLSPFAEAYLPFLHCLLLVGKKPPGVPRFELGHAIQQPSALPTELRCTLTGHRCTLTELRCILAELRCNQAELRCTLISYFLQRFVAGCRESMPCIRRIWSYSWRTPLMLKGFR